MNDKLNTAASVRNYLSNLVKRMDNNEIASAKAIRINQIIITLLEAIEMEQTDIMRQELKEELAKLDDE